MDKPDRFYDICHELLALLEELKTLDDGPAIREAGDRLIPALHDAFVAHWYSPESLYGKEGFKRLIRQEKLRQKEQQKYARAVRRMTKDHLHEYIDVGGRHA